MIATYDALTLKNKVSAASRIRATIEPTIEAGRRLKGYRGRVCEQALRG